MLWEHVQLVLLLKMIFSAFHKVQWRHFFTCGGQVQNHLCRISLGFCVPKIIQIGLFFTELFKKNKNVATFWDTVYISCRRYHSRLTEQSLHARLYHANYRPTQIQWSWQARSTYQRTCQLGQYSGLVYAKPTSIRRTWRSACVVSYARRLGAAAFCIPLLVQSIRSVTTSTFSCQWKQARLNELSSIVSNFPNTITTSYA